MFRQIRKHHDFMWGYSAALLKTFTRPSMVFLIFLSNTMVLLNALVFYWVEGHINPAITSYFDALYFAVTVMSSVGLGDLHPITTGGRVVTMIMMVLGTGIFVCFTAVLAAAILELEQMNKQKGA